MFFTKFVVPFLAVVTCCTLAHAQAPAKTVPFTLPLTTFRDPARPESTPATEVVLGGAANKMAYLRIDLPFVRRVLLRPSDLVEVGLSLKIVDQEGELTGATLNIYRALRAPRSSELVAGQDYEAKPLVSSVLPDVLPGNRMRPLGLGTALQQMLADEKSDFGLVISLLPKSDPVQVRVASLGATIVENRPTLSLAVKKAPNAQLFDNPLQPRPNVYVTVKNGHFDYGGQRLRLWGTLGNGNAARLRRMGFNAWRLWRNPKLYTAKSARAGQAMPAVAGGAPDDFDLTFAELKKNGIFVMFAALISSMPLELIQSEDAVLNDKSFVAPPTTASGEEKADWQAWKSAVKASDDAKLNITYIYFDPRLQTIRKAHAKNLLQHVNPLTGKNYAEDEAIAIYEIFNESGFVKRVLDRGFDGWQPYFRTAFQRRWNDWLRQRYTDEGALKAAWGKLDEGETLTNSGIKLAPLASQVRSYPENRRRDFMQFIIETQDGWNQELRSYCRSLAPQGVGVNVVPLSFDTQYQPSAPWSYVQSRGDVNCFGTYQWDLRPSVAAPPGLYVMDSHTIEGKPTVIYETNQSRPDPYRAEFPFRVAALASYQDWDAVFWHYWAGGDVKSDEEFLTKPMPYISEAHYWTGVHHDKDPVMTSAMALAGRIFLGNAIAPAANPAIFEVGSKGIFSFDRYNGVGMRQQTFTSGAKYRFVPQREIGVQVNGQAPPAEQRITGAVKMGPQVLWDWPDERLIIDTPTAKAYVGKTSPSYQFSDGLTLSGFTTPFIVWSMVSSDGKPLTGAGATSRAYVNAVFDARNTGFAYDWSVLGGGPIAVARATQDWGRAPVQVDKVGYTVSFPNQIDYEWTPYDFALRAADALKKQGTNTIRVSASDAWIDTLQVTRHGAIAVPIVDASPGATAASVGNANALTEAAPERADLWNPLPGVTWAMSYAQAHRTLRESTTRFVSISPESTIPTPDKTLTWTGTEAIFASQANIEVAFKVARMSRIEATFTQPPAMANAVAAYEKQFGTPLEKVLGKAQFEANKARWLVRGKNADLEITLNEAQGELKALYEVRSH